MAKPKQNMEKAVKIPVSEEPKENLVATRKSSREKQPSKFLALRQEIQHDYYHGPKAKPKKGAKPKTEKKLGSPENEMAKK